MSGSPTYDWFPQQFQQAVPQQLGQYQQALGMMPSQQFQQWPGGGDLMPRLRQQRVRERRWYANQGEMFFDDSLYPEDKRALDLLHRHLNDEQWRTLGEHGYFDVVGRMRTLCRSRKHLFRVHFHCAVYEHKSSGRQHYCLVALEPGLPQYDWMLMVKLLIESDLNRFFQTAKRRGWQDLDRYDL